MRSASTIALMALVLGSMAAWLARLGWPFELFAHFSWQLFAAAILLALREANWVVSGPEGAAAKLGVNRSTLQYKMKKFGLLEPQ